ncbi:uncharacterized protein [Anabrus simplex]|uniref:uncharacterized protein n=1 Tax=Anabrus simplex TaxID=316456 RepID=UPI0035A3A64E
MVRSIALIALFAATVYAGYTPIYQELTQPATEECQVHVGANKEDAEKIYMYQILSTQTQACLQYCVYAKLGVMNGTSFASYDYIMAVYRKVHEKDSEYLRIGEETVQGCLDEVNSLVTTDTCRLAKYMQECLNVKSMEKVTHLGPPAS